MGFGKTIRLFLLEGSNNSLVTAELSNWTGKAFKIPKIKLKEFANRDEFRNPGIYILFGINDKNKEAAYIGEGEPVIDRILSHITKKEFWTEVIIFVSKDKYLNKASIKFLENRLFNLGKKVARFDLENEVKPPMSGVSEAEQAELEEFLSNIKLLTATLGHKIFEEIEETLEKESAHQTIFFCKNSTGIHASGAPSTEGFIVFKNSLFLEAHHSSLSESIRIEKDKMVNEGYLVKNGNVLELTKHYTFNSSSRAAAMILGRSSRGPTEWKTESGKELSEFEI